MTHVGDQAPTKSSRLQCWEARDAYFECLDKHGLWLNGVLPKSYKETLAMDLSLIPPPTDPSTLSKEQKAVLYTCQSARDFFEKQCLPSWVGSTFC
jgi:hypothetical protein